MTGTVVLVQYKNINNSGELANWRVDDGSSKGKIDAPIIRPDGTKQVTGYLELNGRPGPAGNGDYIDAPGISPQYKPQDYEREFRVEQFCRCPGQDDKMIGEPVEFRFTRSATGKNTEGTVNFPGIPPVPLNVTVYPGYHTYK